MWRRTEVMKIRAVARDINRPKRSIMGNNGGIACMQIPGDKLLIRQGVYPESINNYTVPYSLPSGTGWNNAFTVAAYPGETALSGELPSPLRSFNLKLAYWIFDGLHVVNDALSGEAIWMISPDHLRFVNMEASTAGHDGAGCVHGDGNFIEFVNIEVHRCGDHCATRMRR